MKELIRHIEILLLDHDCVVVPQIGGFVTRNVPAKYVEEENLFLPPIRTVGFNERLKTDDGLLVRSYVLAYRCSEMEAKKMLGEQIRDLQQELWEDGTCDMGSIGMLTLDIQNNVQFSPCQAGTVCPAYYGLDALLFEPWKVEVENTQTLTIAAEKEAEKRHPVTAADNTEKKSGEYTIRVKKSWIQNVAAVAAVVLLFFLITPDVKNTDAVSANHAEFTQLMWMPSVKTTMPEISVKETFKKEDTPVPNALSQKIGKENPSVGEDPDVQAGYCVVVASAISENNARHYVKRLHAAGYKDAQVYKKGKMVRVVFPGYKTESQAYAKMHALSGESEEFASAWIYKIK